MRSPLCFIIIGALFFTFAFAKNVSALNVLNKVSMEIKTAKTSLEEAKTSLNKAGEIIDKALGIFKFVEEKVSMLYNFESFFNKLYSDTFNWSQDTLKWVTEEKGEEIKKLNYEYNDCYSYI
ncbi:MAG: hypothetical protein ABIJ36_02290 [Patescibacteria group bacterium]|nr:hypothetical protein [Patescibacteria group bacterium]